MKPNEKTSPWSTCQPRPLLLASLGNITRIPRNFKISSYCILRKVKIYAQGTGSNPERVRRPDTATEFSFFVMFFFERLQWCVRTLPDRYRINAPMSCLPSVNTQDRERESRSLLRFRHCCLTTCDRNGIVINP